ncbi:sodium-dependent transporter [Methanosarcina sp. KYL-1]|uniref:sodium-dependent transporter n=1 Tax=Methanosarcina sp. KYL-1 TaxID=2602068 RepID=UPI0021017501|nr:sodium-dependent transporter [Methanosarcina sp. KYL-1]MCQ1537044.1 sodium-dependent transporter [Methanosarcina sp. KYL-1]
MAREVWNTRVGFILAAVGSAVGLGNIWRFSYMAYENGGGAFLIPYFVAILTAGIPLMILEFGLGSKFRGSAPMSLKRAKKSFEWIGWLGVMTGFIITTYYAVIVGWSLTYLVNAFTLGWGTDTAGFLFGEVLEISESPWVLGGFAYKALLGLLAVWAIVWIVEKKGVQGGIEKANKIFMPLLWILLVVLVLRGVTLVGSLEGLEWYLKPDFSKLTDPKIWIAAYGQAFFSLSLGMAIMITYSSYLPNKSDIVNNAFIVSLADAAFSFTMGFAVFGTLGYMAAAKGVGIQEVVASGVGLVFVVLPEALNMLPGLKALTAVVFFLSILVAALSSLISIVEGFAAAMMDKFEMSRSRAVDITIGMALLGSLIYATKGGLYWLDIIDHFVNNYGLLLVGLFEAVAICWVYGGDKIKEWVNSYSDIMAGSWWDIATKVFLPLVLIVLLAQETWNNIVEPYGGGDYDIAALMVGVGVLVAGIIISFIMPRIKKEVE